MTDYDRETVAHIATALQLDATDAARLYEAAAPLWDELSRQGLTDSYRGSEFSRVFPEVLGFVRDRANIWPDGTIPGWLDAVRDTVPA